MSFPLKIMRLVCQLEHIDIPKVCFTDVRARPKSDLTNSAAATIHPLNDAFFPTLCPINDPATWNRCPMDVSAVFISVWISLLFPPGKAAAVCGDKHLRLHELKISAGTTCAALPAPCCHGRYNLHHRLSHFAQICICITHTQSHYPCVCACLAVAHLHAHTHTAEADTPKKAICEIDKDPSL